MKKIVIMLAVVASLLTPLALSPAYASADAFSSSEAKNQACSGINGCTSSQSLDKVIKAVLNILSAVAGVAAVIMIMISGFKYITSGGDGGKVSSAKTTLVYAIIGIIVVAMSQFIAQFVISKSVGTPAKPAKAAIVQLIKRA
jgi:hypothetical protein